MSDVVRVQISKSQVSRSEIDQRLATGTPFILYCFSGDFTPTMQHPDDIDTIVGNTIQSKVAPDDQMANPRADIISSEAEKRVRGELEPAALYCIKDTVGGDGIVLRDLQPDGNQIFIGAACSLYWQHDQQVFSTVACNLRRASAFTSAIDSCALGPLAKPSFTRSRNSSVV